MYEMDMPDPTLLEALSGPVVVPDDDRAAVVCLDCRRMRDGDVNATGVVTPAHRRTDAETYVAEHLATAEHRAVVVPGWPRYRDAIALAKVMVEATRVGRPGDPACGQPVMRGASACVLAAQHLGRCEP